MTKKLDSSSISPTAHITAHAWHKLGIQNAHYFVNSKKQLFLDSLRTLGFFLFLNKKNDYIYFMLEPRHRAIDYFIFSKFNYKQIVEFACGLSPRGITFSDNPEFHYIESDLTEMLNLKKELVQKIYAEKKVQKDNHKFIELDLIHDNISEKLTNILSKEKTVVITEGLTPYFSIENLKKIFTNIAELLRSLGGGVYICDVYHLEDMNRNVLKNPLINIGLNILGVNMILEIKNEEMGKELLTSCGFDVVEALNPLHFSKQLGLKHKIPPEKNVATIYLAHIF